MITATGASSSGWLDVLANLGPIATGAAALVALIVGIGTVRQRRDTDRREQWWKRTQWALELTLSDDPAKVARGYSVLTYLAGSDLAGADEQDLLVAAWEPALENDDPMSEDGSDDEAATSEEITGGTDTASP